MASILAISASQSGPAHSFIVGEALKSAAARAGHKLGLKVISHLGELEAARGGQRHFSQ